ncbi:MAG: hemolysin family protein [Archangium sp.]|nr:hemolysin family protein [Archangium sp.]MDP3158236.1 hemolysin family protein [Archangium sp.]MDP3572481.1 hemolysin family protein [Archangium sp.]
MGLALEVLVLLALVLVNGVLAGAEIAIVSMRKTRLKELVDRGSSSARAVMRLRQHPEGFLATVQIGITVVSATAGAFGGANFAADVAPLLARSEWLAPHASWIAITVVVSLISYLSLVLGELVPKSLALRSSERYALVMGQPLLLLSVLARPLVWALTASSNLVLRVFGDSTNFIEARLSPDELRQLVKEATDAGTVHPQAGEIAARALGFSRLRAVDVMIPRSQVTAVPRDASQETLRRILVGQPHTRVPVYQGQVDTIVGYLSIKDIIGTVWAQKPVVLEEVLRTPLFVPTFKSAVELLVEMRARHQPFAIVMDEHGGFAGLVAMEDLIEELVGEVFNEHADTPEPFRREADGRVLVEGATSVRDVNQALGLALPEGEGWKTIAGLVLDRVATIPSVGETVTFDDGTTLEVVDASARRVKLLRLHAHAK